MRRLFVKLLHDQMEKDENIIVLTADLGYKMFDKINDSFPDRFYNCGSAEQTMLGIGIGLALAKKLPICYSITPFLLFRPAEMIRLYLNHEETPVKLVGAGRGKEYGHDGFTHWAEDDELFLNCFPNVKQYRPDDLEDCFNDFLYNKKPSYINLRK